MREEELHDLMISIDVPPSGADVHRAIAVGRRRVRTRMLLISGTAGVVALAVAGVFVAAGPMRADRGAGPATDGNGPLPVTAPARGCVATALPLPAGVTDATVQALDPGGRIAAGSVGTEDPKPIVWKLGQAPEMLPGVSGVVTAVAADGTVVGYAANEQDDSVGWVFRNGTASTLGKVSGYQWTNPNAINASGVVAGWVHGASLDATAPVVWAADGTPRKLAMLPGVGDPHQSAVMARDIGDDGTVVGIARGVPVVWKPDGTAAALPLPAGAEFGAAYAIAGQYAYGLAGADPARWDLRTGQVVTLPANGDFGANDGTADGVAILPGDTTRTSVRLGFDGHRDLLTGPDNTTGIAWAISADGATVVGTAVAGKEGRPVIWRCH